MSALIRLYPRAWRDRYEAELLDVLEGRPPSIHDRLDIVRGALDAWLHPELVEPASVGAVTDGGTPMLTRIVPLGAMAAGLLWAAAGIQLASSPVEAVGYKDSTLAFVLALVGSLLGGAAAVGISRRLPRYSAQAALAGVAQIVGALLFLPGWPLLVVGAFLVAFASAAFGALLVAAGQRVTGALLGITSLTLVAINTETANMLLTVPYGITWIMLGLSLLAGRPAPAAEPGPEAI